LHKALLRLTQTVSRAPAAAASGEVITVYGVRGGLGATTLAVNLGFKIGTVTGADTAVVDLDVQRGDVAAFVNLVPAHSIATLASAPGEVDDVFLGSALTRHPSGVVILAAPQTIEEAELVTEREVEVALRLLRARCAYTVVDTPRAITSAVVEAFEDSDRILVLTDLSVPSVRAARRAFDLLGRLGNALDHAELLVTEAVPGPIELKKAVQVIGREPFAVIPRDESAGSAMNDGVPLNGRPTRLALALDALACRLAGVEGSSKSSRGLLSRIFPKGARP
jgi:pilus assembly protein CpaE